MALQDEATIERELAALAGWQRDGQHITRLYKKASFADAIAFVNRVAGLAEAADHHPDILVSYDKVRLTLSSHDAGGLTERDFRLAAQIDQ